MNRFDNVSIAQVGYVDAPERLSSAQLCAPFARQLGALGVPPDFLEGITGIRARRLFPEGVQPSEIATMAGRKVLEESGIAPAQIGILINTSVSKDYVEPAVACFVHHRLGLPETCLNFDLSNACLAFLNGMDVVAQMIEHGQVDYGMVVVGESSRSVVEHTVARFARDGLSEETFRRELATLTLGSGGAAMILAHARLAPEGHAYLGSASLAATAHNQLCLGQIDRGLTDSQSLLTHGVALAARTWQLAEAQFGWPIESVDLFALHQVSGPHTAELARAVGFSAGKAFAIYDELGNVGPASVPIALAKAEEAERLAPGDRVVLGGIGSGLNCTVGAVLW